MDEKIEIITENNTTLELAYDFIKSLRMDITQNKLPIGHLKFYLSFNNKSLKISYTTIFDKTFQEVLSNEKSDSVDILVNARIETSPERLREILYDNLHQLKSHHGITINEKYISYFQPGYPNPTHRLT